MAKSKQERQRGLDCLSEERGGEGANTKKEQTLQDGVAPRQLGGGNMRIGFLCFPPAQSCRARLHQPLARLCRTLEGGTSVSTPPPRDKPSAEADPLCIIAVCPSASPPPPTRGLGLQTERTIFLHAACLPCPVDVWCSLVMGCRRKAQPRVVAYAASGFPSTHKCVCV